MILKIAGIESYIDFTNYINVLEIENIKMFKNIVSKLNLAINYKEKIDDILLTENNEIISMNDNMQFVIDPFNIEINTKEVITKLYSKIEHINVLNTSLNEEYFEVISRLKDYVRDILTDIVIDCTMNEEINFKDILKLLSVKIDTDMYQTLEEKIMFLIELMSEFKIGKILVFVNLKQYLEIENLNEIYKYAISKEINLLLIERGKFEKNIIENKIFMDNDFDDFIV